jgi:hypothetical protein
MTRSDPLDIRAAPGPDLAWAARANSPVVWNIVVDLMLESERAVNSLLLIGSVFFLAPCGPLKFRATTALRSVIEEEFDFVEQSDDSMTRSDPLDIRAAPGPDLAWAARANSPVVWNIVG